MRFRVTELLPTKPGSVIKKLLLASAAAARLCRLVPTRLFTSIPTRAKLCSFKLKQ